MCQLAWGGLSPAPTAEGATSSCTPHVPMDWSNENVLALIEMYRSRPVLWNSRLNDYKDRNKRQDAFVDIAATFGVAKEEVERKMKNLICHFSREVKKERDSLKAGTGSEEVYRSKWFAYQSMEFLKFRNRARGGAETQEPLERTTPQQTDEGNPNAEDHEEDTPEALGESTQSTSRQRVKKRQRKSMHIANLKHKLATTLEALAIIKDVQASKSVRDQYTVFGEQIGLQIRDLPSLYARKVVKQIISNVLFEAEMGKYDYPSTTPGQSTTVPHVCPQTHAFGIPLYTPRAGSKPQVPQRVPTPSYHPKHSPHSPTDSSDLETTDNDSIDTLLMDL